jgi:5-methylcytosine-specific restriction endonuclease McrA
MSKDQLPYWQQRQALKLAGAVPKKEERKKKEEKKEFFRDQQAKAGGHCENCGASVLSTVAVNPNAIVAHIVPKSPKQGCPSVATHPLNCWIACGECHTNYDNKGAAYVQNMPIFEELKRRVSKFYNKIAPEERRRVPVYFRPAK